ncbi:MAG: C10 family peptidase, partial [Paludibacter sp.]|nr:C10 family peptidase [Paludibacter sp.]
MRKLILTLTYLLVFITLVFSKSRTSQEALQLVNSFINKTNSSIQKAPASTGILHLVYTSFEKQDLSASANKPYYFVYNIGVNNGFVIVSGDDRAKGILGYSDSGSFDMNTLPGNLKYWLSCYEKELKPLLNNPDSLISMTSVQSNDPKKVSSFATSVSPLTAAIKWNQDAPYNNMCPIINSSTGERAVTGCVATAMAQVMRYYTWPVQGTGTNTYTTSTKKIALTVDFSKIQYDWANMTDTYSSSSTDIQDSAVATLMYHCGVAVNMDYDQSSSAYSTNMARALIKNFGYDQNIQYLLRDYYSRSEWMALLKTELNASRPVLYAGQAPDGGHQFVCDGYDSNDFFHFNWGWGGVSNGYFELSALNPNDQGIGSSSGGYNSDQGIVTGIQKPSDTSTPHYTITTNQPLTSSAASVSRSSTFSITAKEIYNMGINTFAGSLGVALYNDNGFVQVLKYSNVSSLPSYNGWSTLPINSITIPTTVSVGTYKHYCVYKA